MAGNATLELFNGHKNVIFDIWLQNINTASTNEFMTQQTKNRLSWIPIRRAEMFLNFGIVWPLVNATGGNPTPDRGFEGIDPADGFAKMNKLQDTIRIHQLAIANNTTNAPMTLTYTNNSDPSNLNTLISSQPLKSLVYSGWIQTVEKEYARFKNYFVRQYTMNIVTKNVSNTPATNMLYSTAYAPTASTQHDYGDAWINIPSLIQNSLTISGGVPFSTFQNPTVSGNQ
jgi:hypothetical protein